MLNQIKTIMLLGALSTLMVVIGANFGESGLYLALGLALLMNLGSYYFSDKIALAIYGAREIAPAEAPELYDTVSELARRANIPTPRLYRIQRNEPNAFATGRNPENAAVAVTDGILHLLGSEEIKGVLAHEISHIKNRDILVQTIAATIAAAIGVLASIARWGLIFGGFGGRGSDRNNGAAGAIGVLVMAVVAPLAATIIQLAVSRSREYLADETAARLTGNPDGLANALDKLDRGISMLSSGDEGNPAYASLFIVNPLSGERKKHNFLAVLFSTHPPIEKRIARLRGMIL
ncbi:MAG: zinc metalloprotease HtpX [Myxococcota bacterium]